MDTAFLIYYLNVVMEPRKHLNLRIIRYCRLMRYVTLSRYDLVDGYDKPVLVIYRYPGMCFLCGMVHTNNAPAVYEPYYCKDHERLYPQIGSLTIAILKRVLNDFWKVTPLQIQDIAELKTVLFFPYLQTTDIFNKHPLDRLLFEHTRENQIKQLERVERMEYYENQFRDFCKSF